MPRVAEVQDFLLMKEDLKRLTDIFSPETIFFIEFCHNDDDSKDYKSMFNRQTPLGVPDESGRFPVIAGVKMPKNYIPPEYIEALNNDDSISDKQAVLNSVLAINQSYPYDTYYPYSKDASMGSYKWFIKQFIDMARKHDASPVLVTAPARTFLMMTEQLWTLPAATAVIISAI